MMRKELLLIGGLGIFCLGLIFWFIFSESSPFAPKSEPVSPATLANTTGIVEIRRAGQPHWTNAEPGDSLLLGDQLRTSNHAQALLRFRASAWILVDSSTTLTLSQSTGRDPAHIDLETGAVTYNRLVSKRNVPVGVKTAEGTFLSARLDEVDLPAQVREESYVSRYRGTTRATADMGAFRWVVGTTTVDVPETNMLTASSGAPVVRPLKPAVAIRYPAQEAEYPAGYMSRGFNVLWGADAAATGYRVEWMRMDSIPQLASAREVDETGFRVRLLPEGVYRFRVRTRLADGHSLWSEPLSVRIGGTRYLSDVPKPDADSEPIRFTHKPFEESWIVGGYVRQDLVADHEVVVYLQADVWYRQPAVEPFRIPLQPDGYFETVTPKGRGLYVSLVRQGAGTWPELVSHLRLLPIPDGESVRFNVERRIH